MVFTCNISSLPLQSVFCSPLRSSNFSHKSPVTSIVCAGTFIVTASEDGKIILWQADSFLFLCSTTFGMYMSTSQMHNHVPGP